MFAFSTLLSEYFSITGTIIITTPLYTIKK